MARRRDRAVTARRRPAARDRRRAPSPARPRGGAGSEPAGDAHTMCAVAVRSGNSLIRLRDAVWCPTAATMRLLALLGVIVNAGIIVSGGAVRLTASGLGCPTWPKCTGDSLVPTRDAGHPGLNMAIEFGNRTVTLLVLAVGVAAFVAASRLTPRRRDLLRLAAPPPPGGGAPAGPGGGPPLPKPHP